MIPSKRNIINKNKIKGNGLPKQMNELDHLAAEALIEGNVTNGYHRNSIRLLNHN